MYDNEISNLIPEIKAPLDILFAKATVNYESKILSGFFPSKLQAYPKFYFHNVDRDHNGHSISANHW